MSVAYAGRLMITRTKKIRLEADAILTILDRCNRDWELLGSVVLDSEISRIVDPDKRQKVEQKLELVREYVDLDGTIFGHALMYQRSGIRLFDALHLACAQSRETIFLTTDNKIIILSGKIPAITIRVENPVRWLMEVSADENNQ